MKNSAPPFWARKHTVLLLFLVLIGLPIIILLRTMKPAGRGEAQFVQLSNTGKNHYERGDAEKAIVAFGEALEANPASLDARLNLANAHLRANQPEQALQEAREVLNLDPASGAAHFIAGSALLRSGDAQAAAQHLEEAKRIDRTVNAVSFQLGRAYQQLGQHEQAAEQFREVIKFEPNHTAAHYTLSQVLRNLGKAEEAAQELAIHQELMKGREGRITDPAQFEKSQYTQIRVPLQIEQPDATGIKVAFTDATANVFGPPAQSYRGPAGVIDFRRDGGNGLFLMEGGAFRLLANTNGTFRPFGEPLPAIEGASYHRCLVGDLNNDYSDDVVMLGDKGSHAFKVTTNGTITDQTKFSRLINFPATNGLLVDLDHSAKLGVLLVEPTNGSVQFLRNLGHPYFTNATAVMGIPPNLTGIGQLAVEDWTQDDSLDLIIGRANQPPLLLASQRGGPLVATNPPVTFAGSGALAAGDLNNDLRADLIVATGQELVCVYHGLTQQTKIPVGNSKITALELIDYDNDGWLDVLAMGDKLRVWRNRGDKGFEERTTQLGLDKLAQIAAVDQADFDCDGDTDLLVTRADRTLQLLRNDGGNTNQQLKLRLTGNKSNKSGLGARVDVAASGLRITRRIRQLPIEIGVSKHSQVDSINVRWLSLDQNYGEAKIEHACALVSLPEPEFDTDGSCPFLYAWDGHRFRFVTDLLGAAPMGLPLSEGRYIEADPFEYVWLGDESALRPKNGSYVLQVTEELREVLYLDEAKLVIVDHPPDTEVHTTSKLLPGKPFPPHQIVTLEKPRPLLEAITHEGKNVTAVLATEDGKLVSPSRRRGSQLLGLAEPHSITLDFGPLDVEHPLVLAMTGWLRFGGGTANIGASHNPDLPFPFPTLEVEVNETWKPVDVIVGAPAGKTKRMIVDLTGKLPPGSRRLRLATAFEIHWDRISLFEKRDNSETRITTISPAEANLHWRGYSQWEDWPWYYPLSPNYDKLKPRPSWRTTPTGWCTRYGEVGELIDKTDNALALLNGGDELTLAFPTANVPAKSDGKLRTLFFYSVGWDKDADFHCKLGSQVEPLPWHGMDDQRYGEEPRPSFPGDALMKKYTTRWVGPHLF